MVVRSVLALLLIVSTASSSLLNGPWENLARERLKLSLRIRENHEFIARRRNNYSNLHELSSLFKTIAASKALSTECMEDIMLLASADAENNSTARIYNDAVMPMLDSSAGLGTGVLTGHIIFHGYLTECTSIDVPVEGRVRNIKGGYFRLGIDYGHGNNTDPGACTQEKGFVLTFGKCLPISCSSAELQEALRPNIGQPSIPNAVCTVQKMNDDVPELDAPYYIVLIFICTIAAISIAIGLVDFFMSEYLSESVITKTLLWKILMSFSLYSNVSSIFDISSLNKSGQIGPLHCIRFFSMAWVTMCHYAAFTLYTFDNPVDFLNILPNILSEFIINGFPSVDTFFFLSGLLVSFLWFKMYKLRPRATNSPGGWAMFYIHRILRLSPPFYISVILSTFVFNQWFRDVPFNMNVLYSVDTCKKGWWVDLLYIHNFVMEREQCSGYTWYLGTDLQMFIFTPLILLPMALKPLIGWIIASVFIVLSTASNIFIVYHFHYPADMMFNEGTLDPELTDSQDYSKWMYQAPYIRCQIYIIGMLTGWIMQYKRRICVPKLLNLALWMLTAALMLACVLGLHENSLGHYIEIFWRAMYSSLFRVAWGLSLGWIVIACWYGYGGPINSFMSWYIWAPLGRLSYCAYLMHIPVMMLILGQSTDGIVFTTFLEWFIIRIVPCVVFAFLAAVLWSSFFEISFGKIEMLLLGGLGAARRKEKEDPWPVEKEEETNTYNITPVLIENGNVTKERL